MYGTDAEMLMWTLHSIFKLDGDHLNLAFRNIAIATQMAVDVRTE